VITVVWAGLAVGAIYALIALCMNVVLATSGVFNFAQPQITMAGAFLAYEGRVVHDLPLVVVIVGAAVAGGVIGFLEERIAIRPLKGDVGHATLVTTVGAAVTIQGIALLVWGTTPKSVPFPGRDDAFSLLGGRLLPLDLILLGLAVVLAVALHVGSRRTVWGLAGRAATTDRDAARLRGIDVLRVRALGFFVAGALSGALGVIVAAKIGLDTEMGNRLVILGFVALALGGFGSYLGCLAGGLIAGLVQLLTTRYIGGDWALIALFVLLVAVLFARPTGLFGNRQLRFV
jgi:branched-chain amino acid transport system permease protein